MNDDYPVHFSVDYGDGRRNRLTTFFRLILAIPILFVVGLLGSTGLYWVFSESNSVYFPTIVVGIALLILARRKYPRWVFDFLLEVNRLGARDGAYLLLLVDEYPSTDEEQSVHLEIAYPDVEVDLNRFLPLVKWLLAIPHYVVLVVLSLGVIIGTVVAWFAILFTGTYPRGIFDFVLNVSRWGYRVNAYAYLLVTDRYPPFRLSP